MTANSDDVISKPIVGHLSETRAANRIPSMAPRISMPVKDNLNAVLGLKYSKRFIGVGSCNSSKSGIFRKTDRKHPDHGVILDNQDNRFF
jgi:hypothetical protein